MKTTSTFFALVAILLIAPSFAKAGEIQYGTLTAQHGDTLLLEYKGPAGQKYFTCTTENKCSSLGSTLPTILPSLLGSKTYKTNADGTLAIKPFSVGTLSYNFLYDISGDKPKKIALIPYTKTTATVFFSKNNNAIIFQDGTTFTRFDIATKKLSTLKTAQQLSF